MTKDDQAKPSPDDIARVRAQSERRFVVRCSACNREIARSSAKEAGWQHLDSGPHGPHPRCPDCAERQIERAATCSACGSKIAASAATDFGWRYWQDRDGKRAHYCPACAIKLVTDR